MDNDDSAKTVRSGPVSERKHAADPLRPRVDADDKTIHHDAAKSVPELHVRDRYVLEEEIARGGMGVILKGRDNLLGRELAFKVLLDAHRGDSTVTQRFVEEAQIGGQLQHPGIVPIHEIGKLDDARPFFTMKLVDGKTLADLLQERTNPAEDLSRFLGIFDHVCQTIAYAHSRGVVHRDLKPSNIMVGAFGEVQVMDWGVAKVLQASNPDDADQRLLEDQQDLAVVRTLRDASSGSPGSTYAPTETGAVIGTPAYMPPEQARGEINRLDKRADVFGLGAILCVILTGEAPYVGEDNSELLKLAAKADLAGGLARLDKSGAEAELIGLAKQCLTADPDQRPADAKVVADKVSGYLATVTSRLRQAELDRLKAQTKTEEERKRRSMTLALACSVLLAAALWTLQQTRLADTETELARARTEAAEQRSEAAEERTKAAERQAKVEEQAKLEIKLALADVFTSRGVLAADENPGLATLWFAEAALLSAGDPDRLRDNHLRARNWARETTIPVALADFEATAGVIRFQPGGHLLLIRKGGRYSVWDWQGGRMLPWLEEDLNVQHACWRPDGAALAVATTTGKIQIRNVWDGLILSSLPDQQALSAMAYSRDGRYLALAGTGLRVWDGQSQQLVEPASHLPAHVHSLLFNRDGSRLVAATADKMAQVFAIDDPALPAPLFEPVVHEPFRTTPPAFVDDDQGLITVTGNVELTWWNAETGELVRQVDTSPMWQLSHVTASDSGDLFASGGYYGPFVWSVSDDAWKDADANHKMLEYDHKNFVDQCVFSSDGSILVGASWDRMTQLWSLPDGAPLGFPLEHVDGVHKVALSDDNVFLATVQFNGQIRVWQRPSYDATLAVHRHWGEYVRVSFDGRWATPGTLHETTVKEHTFVRQVRVVETDSGLLAGPPITPPGVFVDSCVCGDNLSVAIVSKVVNSKNHDVDRGWLTVWDVQTGQPTLPPVEMSHRPVGVSARPDSSRLAVVCADGTLYIVDGETGERVAEFDDPIREKKLESQALGNAVYTSDGAKLVYAATSGVVYVFDGQTMEQCFAPIDPARDQHLPAKTFKISADDRLLATGSEGGARVWDLEGGEPLCDLLPIPGKIGVLSICFSPDGQQVLTASGGGQARVWDWKSGALACPTLKHDDIVFSAAFTPDGRYAVTGARGENCGPYLWDLTTGKRMAPGGIKDRDVRSVAVVQDGTRVLASFRQVGHLAVVNVEEFVNPSEAAIEELRVLGELSSSQILEAGDTNSLTVDEWEDKWNEYCEIKVQSGWLPERAVAHHQASAQRLLLAGKFIAALAHLRQATIRSAELDETDRALSLCRIHLLRATIMRRQLQPEQAKAEFQRVVELLQRALSDRPEAVETSRRLARTLLAQVASVEQEEADPSPLVVVSRLGLNGYAALGAACLLQNNLNEALTALTKAFKQDSSDVVQQMLLTLSQKRLGQSEAAKDGFHQAASRLASLHPREPVTQLVRIVSKEVGGLTDAGYQRLLKRWRAKHDLLRLSDLIERNPDALSLHSRRGEWLAARGRWQEAVADFRQLVRLAPSNHYYAFQFGCLLARVGEKDAYRAHVEFALTEWIDAQQSVVADRIAVACLLRSDSGSDPDDVAALVEQLKQSDSDSVYYPWFLRCIALHAYRTGRFANAVKACRECRDRMQHARNHLTSAVDFIEAMASQKLGDKQQARILFNRARTDLEENLPSPQKGNVDAAWPDWLIAKVLLDEADQLLSDMPKPK